jgi:hypothetical protein
VQLKLPPHIFGIVEEEMLAPVVAFHEETAEELESSRPKRTPFCTAK